MKKIYTKPACQYVNIQLNDLCVGSKKSVDPMNIYVLKRNKEQRDIRVFSSGQTDGMWDTNL